MNYAQNGEDELLFEIITEQREVPTTCVEVGAADGLWLSNTAALWKDNGWRAVLIESDDGNFVNLRENTKGYENVTAVHIRISPTGPGSMDAILQDHGVSEVGVMSIDIDGDDYHIFKNLRIRPRILLVEFNATFPPEAEFVGDVGSRIGCSARSLIMLATEKGYKVRAFSGSNVILVDHRVYPEPLLSLETENLKLLRRFFPTHSLSYVVQSYDGDWAVYRSPVFGMKNVASIEGKGFWSPGGTK